MKFIKDNESADRFEAYLIDMVKSLQKLRDRIMEIRHMEGTGSRVRKAFVRQRRSSGSDERRERVRRFLVRPKSEIYEDILMPNIALGRRFWNMINS